MTPKSDTANTAAMFLDQFGPGDHESGLRTGRETNLLPRALGCYIVLHCIARGMFRGTGIRYGVCAISLVRMLWLARRQSVGGATYAAEMCGWPDACRAATVHTATPGCPGNDPGACGSKRTGEGLEQRAKQVPKG
jgi:hypothetical protein